MTNCRHNQRSYPPLSLTTKTHPAPHVSCPHMKPLLAFFLTFSAAAAADLTLLDAGKTDYQIVLPDAAPTPAIDASLQQTAFLVNKAEIAILREKGRDAAKPALILEKTVLAQKSGVEVMKLRDWSYASRREVL